MVSSPIDIPTSPAPHKSPLPTNFSSPYDFLLLHTPKSSSDKNNEGNLLLPWRSPDINNAAINPYLSTTTNFLATIPAQQISKSLETSHDSLESQIPHSSVDCGLTKAHLLPNSHKSYEMDEEIIQYLQGSRTKRMQEQEKQLNNSFTANKPPNEHLLVEAFGDYLMVTSTAQLDDTHYRKLATLMEFICDGLQIVMKTSMQGDSNKIDKIK